jgi:hypothetical protein
MKLKLEQIRAQSRSKTPKEATKERSSTEKKHKE